MNWKNEMILIEQTNDWKSGIQLAENVDKNDPEVFLRILFLLLDLLVEGQYTQEEHDYAAKKVKEIFNKSNQKFSKNAEFLFFSGIMIYTGEWYFGMESVKSAKAMLESAMRMEPDNTLYKWGYYSRIDQRPEQNTDLKLKLSEQLLFNETSRLDWLKSKGLLGKYVLGTLEGAHEDLKAIKASN